MTKLKVTLENVMGDDLDVVKDAKVSFDNDKTADPEGWECVQLSPFITRDQPILTGKKRNLIKFLVRGMSSSDYENLADEIATCGDVNRVKELLWQFRKTPIHAAPFGHGYLKFTVEAPVFVARQLVKHEYLRMSEVSRRYVQGDPEYFLPDNFAKFAEYVKQGSDGLLDGDAGSDALALARLAVADSDDAYKQLMAQGVAPEDARMILPLCHMTRWRWSGSLDAFMNMCVLRMDAHAQSYTREVAGMIGKYIKRAFPQSWASYVEGDI